MRALTALLTVLLVVCVAAAYTYQWKRIPIARNSVFVNSNQLPQQQQQQSCSYSYSNSYGYRSSYGNCYRLFSSNGLAFDNDYKDLPTIKEEIAIIIEAFLSEVKDINQPLNINPAVLIEFSYVLTKGKLYEEVMGELLTNAKDYIEVQALELVDNSMKNFVISERKSRARLKMNYILAGASSNRLEQSITILKER